MKTISAVAVLCLSASVAFAAPQMREGNWEMTTKVKVEGIAFDMPPLKMTHCFTKEDVKDNRKMLPSAGDNKNSCEVQDMKQSGDSATWKTVCKDGTVANGKITYKGDSYVSTMTMTDKRGGKSTTSQTARRIGDCRK